MAIGGYRWFAVLIKSKSMIKLNEVERGQHGSTHTVLPGPLWRSDQSDQSDQALWDKGLGSEG